MHKHLHDDKNCSKVKYAIKYNVYIMHLIFAHALPLFVKWNHKSKMKNGARVFFPSVTFSTTLDIMYAYPANKIKICGAQRK